MHRQTHSYRTDPAVPAFPDDRPVIVFDGLCGLCAASVQFFLRHDRGGLYRFLPAQSPLGMALYRHLGLDETTLETVILLKDGVALFKAEAGLQAIGGLGGAWRLVNAARIFPRPVRDFGYDLVAKNRFRLFGRRDACFLPSPETRSRFLA